MNILSRKDIAALISNTPPARRRGWKFLNVGKCNAEIVRLEGLLGIEPSGPTFNISRANTRVLQLEDLLAQKNAQPAPAAAAPAAAHPVTTAPAVEIAKPELFGRDRQAAATVIAGLSHEDAVARDQATRPPEPKKPLFGLDRMIAATKVER